MDLQFKNLAKLPAVLVLLLVVLNNSFAQPSNQNSRDTLYFYPPSEEKWIVGTSYVLSVSNSTYEITAIKMQVVPTKCGWFSAVFSRDEIPDGNFLTWISLGSTLGMDLIGKLGVYDEWVSGVPEPINLKDKFDSLSTGTNTNRAIYFNPEDSVVGWYGIDPGYTDRSRCSYKMAAVIYDTDQSIYDNANNRNKLNGPFKCGIDQTCGLGSGISRGIPQDTLNAERKMVWRGEGDAPVTTNNNIQSEGGNDGWYEEAFVEAFISTPGKNVQRCYDMPFERNKQGLWEFDSDRLCANGEMDPDANGLSGCNTASAYGGFMGGFFPLELQDPFLDSDGNPGDYSECDTCRALQQADAWVLLNNTVNKWCFDRGWSSTGTTTAAAALEGNLDGLTTAEDIDAEMRRICGATARPFASGQLGNGNNPAIWNWNNGRPNFGTTNSRSSRKNLFFCFESHSEFTYEPGQEFFFRGDDDIWIFINKRLIIDLGGSHLAAPGYVKLDTIGLAGTMPRLVEGQRYPIDIFFCDSRSTMSNVRITTNMYFSQSSGWNVNGVPTRDDAKICLTIVSSGSQCGSAIGTSKDYCGLDIGSYLEYYLERVGPGTQTALNLENENCEMDVDRLRCYGGISIDLDSGIVRIEQDKLKDLGAGTYKLQAEIKSDYKDTYPAPPLTIAQFSIIAGISVVWGEIWKDDADDTPKEQIYDLGAQNKNTIAGRLVPVGFAGGIWTGENKFEVSMDPYDGSPGKTFRLDQTGLVNDTILYSELKVYRDSLGTEEIAPSATLTIPENGLLVLWVTGELRATDDVEYKVNINGASTAGSTIKVFLPRIKFIDPATASSDSLTILPTSNCQTKGSEYRCPNSNISADSLKTYVGSQMHRTLAAFDVSGSNGEEPGELCLDCNFQIVRHLAWAIEDTSGTNNELMLFTPSPLPNIKDGMADIYFQGAKEIMPENYAFFTIGGPSTAAKTFAQWDSITFETPIVPIPISAEIYDRNGDGIGDSIRIAYDTVFVVNDTLVDNLPNFIEIFWDLSLSETIGFGPDDVVKTNKDGGYEYNNKEGAITNEQLLNYWKTNHKLEGINGRDSIIVITIDDENGFSGGNIKTSVGPGDIVIQSWTSFVDAKKDITQTASFSTRIKDRIPPIVVSARYTPDETSNCSSSDNPCRDAVIINLSEPVISADGDVSDVALKTAFAYKLVNLYDVTAQFETYDRPQDLATRMTWTPSGRPTPALTGDSIVNFTFDSYKIPGGDTTKTPVANDSVKLSSIAHKISVPALLDLAAEDGFPGNSANPAEIGRRIEGLNRSESVKIPLAELDPNDDVFKDSLDRIFEGLITTEEIFPPGGNNVGWLPVPESWINGKTSDSIGKYYPASVGMVFNQDINSYVSELEKLYKVTIPDSAIKFHAKVFYHTNLGDYVVHRNMPAIRCDNPIFMAYGDNCRDITSKQGIYIAWNLKDAKDRWVGAGAYVGIYDYYWKIEYNEDNVSIKEIYDKKDRKIEMVGVKRVKRN